MVPRSARIWSRQPQIKKPFMKFVTLTKPIAVPHHIHTYTELLQQIHHDPPLRQREVIAQRPESLLTDAKQLPHMILLLSFPLVGSCFAVSTHHPPLPNYPLY